MIAASRPKQPGHVLSIADATTATLHLLALRRRVLRLTLVVAGLVITLAIVSLPFAPLSAVSAIPFLLCLWSCYIAADTWLVCRWRLDLLRAWQAGLVNLGVFGNAIRSQPKLPSATMEALLRSLPILPSLRDRDLAAPDRAVVAAYSNWRWTEETTSLLLPAALVGLASALAVVSLVAATVPHRGTLGTFLVLMLGVLVARYSVPARSRRQLTRELATMAPYSGSPFCNTRSNPAGANSIFLPKPHMKRIQIATWVEQTLACNVMKGSRPGWQPAVGRPKNQDR